MIKKIVILTTLVLACTVHGQEGGTSSPYSFYGIGLQQFRGTVENRAMGGLSLFSDSLHLNIVNPAQLGRLRFVNFTVGGNHNSSSFEEAGVESEATNTTVDYIALGFPISPKAAVSFGVVPWRTVGYDIDASENEIINRFTGSGGVNRAYLSGGYELSKGLYIGATSAYYFGNVRNEILRTQQDVELGTQESNRTDFFGFGFEIGAQYERKITKKLEFRSSIQYNVASELRGENERQVSSVVFNDLGMSTELDIREGVLEEAVFSLPSSVVIGLGIGEANKWFVGGEFTSSETSNFFNNTFRTQGAQFVDSFSYRAGGFYIPNYNSIRSYFERITFRGGLRYEELGLRLSQQDISEFGISFGVGLPTRRNISNLNITVEYGQRGTTEANLVQEDFFNFGLSLSLNDIWFLKRKFN